MVEALPVQRTFLDDVAIVAHSLELTLRELRLSTQSFPKLETVLTEQLKPTAIQDHLLDLPAFIALAGEYLHAVPLDVSIGLTDDAKAQNRGPHEALRNQYVGSNLFGQNHWKQFYDDPVRVGIDARVSKLEADLNSFGTILARTAAKDLPGETFIPIGGINSSYIGSLRVQAYRNAGLRLYEDPERMFTLSFRALAQKKGWITRATNGNYQLAKNGPELISQLHDVGLSEQLFEQYTGAHINLTPAPLAAATPLRTPAGSVSDFTGRGINLMNQTSTWAQGYHALRAIPLERDSPHPRYDLSTQTGPVTFYRPLTLGENLRARIVDARAHNNNVAQAPSWSKWNDSCTAIIYGQSGKFKVQKISHDLLDLAPDFRQAFFQGRYETVSADGVNAMEFERRNVKYNEGLTQEEVLRHPFWQFVADGNTDALRDYTQLQWAGKQPKYKGMGVWLRDSPQNGELRALFVDDRSVVSYAYGNYDLNVNGSFLRVS